MFSTASTIKKSNFNCGCDVRRSGVVKAANNKTCNTYLRKVEIHTTNKKLGVSPQDSLKIIEHLRNPLTALFSLFFCEDREDEEAVRKPSRAAL